MTFPVQRRRADCEQQAAQQDAGASAQHLVVGPADDPLEREADAVAAQVVADADHREPRHKQTPSPPRRGQFAPQRAHAGALASELATSAGEPLRDGLRRRIESTLRADLSDVRVHADPSAQRHAGALGALAFTHRNHIFLGADQRADDPALMAHEAAHAVQQRGSARAAEIQRLVPMGPALPIGSAISIDAMAVLMDDNLAGRSEQSRIDSITRLLDTWWVGPMSEAALERLWGSFGNDIERVANDHIGLWQRSYQAGMEVTNLQIPAVAPRIDKFEQLAVEKVLSVLTISERQVNTEMVRYGISREVTGGHAYTGVIHTDYMQDTPESRGLAAAARRLHEQRQTISRLQSERSALVRPEYRGVHVFHDREIRDMVRYRALGEDLRQAQADHNQLRMALEPDFPILAAYAEPGWSNDNALESIAAGAEVPAGRTTSAAARVLSETIYEHLHNIQVTRARIVDEPETIWRLERIVAMTRQALGLQEGTFASALIAARADEAEADQAFVDTVLAALAIGFGLLAALPTGGSSLLAGIAVAGSAASLAVNTGIAARSAQRYQFEAAAAGSDFDQARALAAEDPSLFWLAVDIVGAGLELGAARQVFRGAAPTIRRAMRSVPEATLDEVEGQVATLVRQSGATPPEGQTLDELAQSTAAAVRRSVAEAQDGQAALARVREALVSVADAGLRRGDELIDEARLVAPIERNAHHLRAAPNGLLVRCSDQCMLVRRFYLDELAENDELLERLDRIEAAARQAPDGGPWEQQAITLLADLRQQRGRPLRALLDDAADLDRLLDRALPPGTADGVLEALANAVRSGDFEVGRLQRMVQVVAGADEVVLRHLLSTQVRINRATAGGERMFHGFDSAYWDRLSDFEEVSMLEAQIRGYRPARGRPRRIATGASGEVLAESTTGAGARADVLVGDSVDRLGLEREVLESRGEVNRLAEQTAQTARQARQDADEAARLAEAALQRGDPRAAELGERAERLAARAAELADAPIHTLSRLLTDMFAERLHASGAGFGIELTTGIAFGPEVVNQIYQNQGVEALIRFLHTRRPPGVRYRVHLDLELRQVADRPVLQSITYRVEMVQEAAAGRTRDLRPAFEASIGVPEDIRRSDQIHRGGRSVGVQGVELDVDTHFGALAEHFGLGAQYPSPSGLAEVGGLGSLHDAELAQLISSHRLRGEGLVLDRRSFEGVDLWDVSLRDAQLRHCDLRDADLRLTDLRGADLEGSLLVGAQLNPERLRGATMPDGVPFELVDDLGRYIDPGHPNFYRPPLLR